MSATSATARVSWADVEQTRAALASEGFALELDVLEKGRPHKWGLFTSLQAFIEEVTRHAEKDVRYSLLCQVVNA